MLRHAATALVLVLLGAGVARAEDECLYKRVVELPTQPEPNGHLMVPAELAGHPTHLLLDTGGAWSLIDTDVAKTLALSSHYLPLYSGAYRDAAGNPIDHYVSVPTMKLGPLAFDHPVDFLIAPLAHGQPVETFAGSLGLNVLSKFDLDIDNAKQIVSLFLPAPVASCGVYWSNEAVSLPFTLRDELPVAHAIVDGEKVDALIDSGTSTTTLDVDFARRHFNLTANGPGVTNLGTHMMPGGKVAQIYRASVKILTISGIQFENVPVDLMDLDGVRLILGMNELKRLHLYFNFKGKTIYATAADVGFEPETPLTPAPAH